MSKTTKTGAKADRTAGERYLLSRWLELAQQGQPWWARAEGIGFRLRLKELHALAEAREEAGVRDVLVEKLVDEARPVFSEKGLCGTLFPEAAAELGASFRTSADAWLRRGAGPSAAGAALQRFDSLDFHGRILDALVAAAAGADFDLKALEPVGELLELLDAELIFDGHSPRWRRDLVVEVKRRFDAGEEMKSAISESLKTQGHCPNHREFDVVIPVGDLDADNDGRGSLQLLDPEEAERRLASWRPREEGMKLLEDPDFSQRQAYLHYLVQAADAYAAARVADDAMRRELGRWSLRGEDREVVLPRIGYVYDADAAAIHKLSLPAEPLPLVLSGLDAYDALADDERLANLDDALAQLAQARTAAPAVALMDLWIAAETLFGGVMDDPSPDAGLVIARLAQFPYARDLHVWMAGAMETAGLGAVSAGSEVAYVVERMGDFKETLARVKDSDVLAWARLKRMGHWDPGSGFLTELEDLTERMRRVTNRAYLIRNFVVHRAQGAVALEVTLPLFADLVRVSVDHCLRFASRQHGTLHEAKFAVMQAQGAALDFKQGRSKPPDGLEPLMDRPIRQSSQDART